MGFLRRVAGVSLRDRVRSSVIREELGVEPLLLCVERSQLRSEASLCRTGESTLCPANSQTVRLYDHKGRLCFSCLSSEVQPLPPERAGPELQSSRKIGREAADCWTKESRLETGNSQPRPWWRAKTETWSEEILL
ncbi:hypothetical protein EPR50_G00229570 [Perca flavescens]|uniref:Uncharacterized protein n=1 Tax=Perca flavescens TaxID=8167 RepID=A0A484BZT5_PERFV|nr:hypothetical protein EPR50_G00229570 [Perca flavescens]